MKYKNFFVLMALLLTLAAPGWAGVLDGTDNGMIGTNGHYKFDSTTGALVVSGEFSIDDWQLAFGFDNDNDKYKNIDNVQASPSRLTPMGTTQSRPTPQRKCFLTGPA